MTTDFQENTPLRARLREGTREWHEAVELDVDLTSPTLDIRRYQQILGRFFGFYQPWEASAGKVLCNIPEALETRRKTESLRADLTYFGIDPDVLPVCERVPPVATVAEALGGCYVVEGATLGGQIIARHLHVTLGITPECGGRFFHGYGADTGRRWKAFQELLQRYCDNGHADETLAAAQETFRSFAMWLREA
jgi:heme oxygenase